MCWARLGGINSLRFFLGSLAIIGFPPLSGFFSKDLILLHSLENPILSIVILLIGSLLSSFYSFKILYYAFYNTPSLSLSSFHSFHPSPQDPSLSFFFRILKSLPAYGFLFPFLLVLSGSLFLGYFSSSFFSSPDSLNLDLEVYLNNSKNPLSKNL